MRMLITIALLAAALAWGCAMQQKPARETLDAPPGVMGAVAAGLERGNDQFAAQQWIEAREIYESVISLDPSLAEAHYNLALTLDRLGDSAEARKHYIQAANLAPGHKVIWNAPPLRKFDRDRELDKKSYMDPRPQ